MLETLTDTCDEYMLQMTKLMRHAVDREAQHGTTGFQVTPYLKRCYEKMFEVINEFSCINTISAVSCFQIMNWFAAIMLMSLSVDTVILFYNRL